MTANEFIEVTSINFDALTSDGLTGKEIVKVLDILAIYAAILCQADSHFKDIFLVHFIKSQKEAEKYIDEIITIDTSKLKPT